jgi:hypothetical protein
MMMTKQCEFAAKLATFLLTMILLVSHAPTINAQSDDPPRYEVAAEFSALTREDLNAIRAELGVGGRFTFNLNKHIAFEGAGYFFPRSCFDCPNNGRVTEVVGGLKAGKRFEKWGLFGKVRPGFVNFSKGQFNILPNGSQPSFPFTFQVKPLTNFATDVGGVLEFYPSRHIVTRFDAGDTIINIRERMRNDLRFDPATSTFSLVPIRVPGRTTHNFQFSASVGYRW